ncbi:MAG TPA: SpoIVB peptidase S55 domain-containing protein [Terriglobia bacterium]
MRLRQVLAAPALTCSLVVSLALVAFFVAGPDPRPMFGGPAGQDSAEFFPLNQVHAGLKGVGKTVFEGNDVTEFQVEILGVLRSVLAPKHDAILVKLSGGGIERTNIVAGMSGSPVYVDGKLLGAVAISFPFAKEPYGLVTPIEDMLAVTPAASSTNPEGGVDGVAFQGSPGLSRARFARVAGGSADDVRLIQEDSWPPQAGQVSQVGQPTSDEPAGMAELLSSLRLPVRFSGFDGSLIRQYAPAFRALGLEPVEGGVLTGATSPASEPRWANEPLQANKDSSTEAVGSSVQPGKMVSLLFVSGDFNLAADCTVTYRQGDRLYACGHQVFQMGQTDIPFAPARVLATIPSLTVSFKVDDPGSPVGSIHQDRFGAIYGVVGQQASTIPVSVRVDSTLHRTENYRFDVAQAPLISPLLVQLALASTVGATERALGPSTLHLKGQIRLAGGEAVDLEDVLASDTGAANMAGVVVAAPLNILLSSDFPGLHVEGIDVDLSAQDKDRAASLDEVWASKSEVLPGDNINLMAVVRTPSGETFTQKIPVHIPENVSSRMLSLVVGSGAALDALEGRLTPLASQPRDVHQMVRALNRMRRNNRLYALLLAPASSFRLQGEEFPSPPPSLLQTFMSDPASATRVTLSATSVVGDFETAPTPYTVAGQQTLLLKVVRKD